MSRGAGAALLAAALLALLGGCATQYEVGDAAGPTAGLNFVKAEGGVMMLFAYASPDCAEGTGGMFGQGLSAWQQGSWPYRVKAGAPLWVKTQMNVVPGPYTNQVCLAQTRFTPQAGRTYDARPEWRGGYCQVVVLDTATGAPPPDAEGAPVPRRCGGRG